ncbi:MAG: Crp/Fnr family transcriptional regulator [Chitinophaga sp.]|uniref:Crp/Fnr family transcriptional regulator n=1 Tax=Chitinophaga sp. TaxID=1869181 RepID=UPI0025C12B61|nr:Crp/Fnr family transcriptional regulator [Chitinophaga sp.]MBV8252407.1 Crp/Fnr family transcriptional regulator [Chitinophaga sp.]
MFRTNESFYSFIEDLYNQPALRDQISLKVYDKGDFLLQQGDTLARVLIIREGIAKCYSTEDNGKDFIRQFMGKGQQVGDLEVIKGIKCMNNVQAITPLTAFAVAVPYFRHLYSTNLKFSSILMEELADRLIITDTKATLQQLYTLEHSLRKLLELMEIQQLTISKEDMASYLGISVRSLNRILKTL